MKNIFKFFGIAAIACSVMVACNNDPEDEPETTPAITVSFDGNEWTSNEAMVLDSANYFDVYKSATADYSSLQFRCPLTVGAHGLADSNNYVIYWEGETEYNTYDPTGTITISAIDVNGKVMSAVIATNMVKDSVNHPLTAAMVNAKWE
ncbi:MAG: hypothetical protein IK058_03890 [Bacteroidales bacterium]|nr:hypothetical protein [Bacteroidales bacterium]